MLITASGMREYFRDALTEARALTGVEVSDHAEAYLVQLLAEFSRSEKLFAGTDRGEKPTLAIMLQRAREAEAAEAVRIYKHMGDSSLYLTGFFAESVEHEIVSRDYYVEMGGGAYASAATLMRGAAASWAELFGELAARFDELVELLSTVSLFGDDAQDVARRDAKVLALLERYRRTGRKELLEKLGQLGVTFRPGALDDDGRVH